TSTWPPPGPMSLVFTGKTYIDFRRSNINIQDGDIWTSQEFENVLRRLKEAVPDVETNAVQKMFVHYQSIYNAGKYKTR
ncbi:unnamed protein product, partial [Rotaria sp. Silwood1]